VSTSPPDPVVALLRSVGWHENRSVSLDDFRDVLQRAGCLVSNAAEQFLLEFHGLRIDTEHCFLDFDVQGAVGVICREDIEHLASLVGEPVCAIGYTAEATLFMTPSGRVIVCALDWVLMRVFNNHRELLRDCTGEISVPALYLTKQQMPKSFQEDD